MKLAFSNGPMLRNQSLFRLGQCLRNQSPRTVPLSAPQIILIYLLRFAPQKK